MGKVKKIPAKEPLSAKIYQPGVKIHQQMSGGWCILAGLVSHRQGFHTTRKNGKTLNLRLIFQVLKMSQIVKKKPGNVYLPGKCGVCYFLANFSNILILIATL